MTFPEHHETILFHLPEKSVSVDCLLTDITTSILSGGSETDARLFLSIFQHVDGVTVYLDADPVPRLEQKILPHGKAIRGHRDRWSSSAYHTLLGQFGAIKTTWAYSRLTFLRPLGIRGTRGNAYSRGKSHLGRYVSPSLFELGKGELHKL